MEWTVFGERLSKELEKKQLSYRQFAEKVGMTTTTVFRYAKCERVPRANEIIKIAKVLGVTCDYLLGLSDDPHKTSMSYAIAQPERVEGEWIPHKSIFGGLGEKVYTCDKCGYNIGFRRENYCPNCGSYNGGEKSKGDN